MIKSVDKALRVLEILSTENAPVRLREIAEASELTRTNAFRILQTLRDLGYVVQNDDGTHYELSYKLFEMGARKVGSNTLVNSAHDILLALSHELPENVMLSVREGLLSVVVDRIESRAFVRSFAYLGARAPVHTVSAGKVLLAHAPEAVIAEAAGKLTRLTEHTITTEAELRTVLQAVRDNGYATAQHESAMHACGLAVPIWSRFGTVLAALSVSSPTLDLSRDGVAAYVPILQDHAARIQRAWPDGQRVAAG